MRHLVPIVLLVTQVPAVAPQEGATQPDKSWLAAAQAEVQRSEYRFQAVKGEAGVWSAPNRAQELRSRVSAEGLEVFPRAASADGVGAPWKLHLATTSFGRSDGVFALPPASVATTGERVELDHGHLVEWLVNDGRGIEQGWDVPYKPVGSGELWIGLAIEGDLALRIEDGARSGVLMDACGDAVLRYRDLRVFDAAGRELPAWLRSNELGFGIAIDDAGASYPLTVDPLLTGPQWTAFGNQLSARFGNSVSSAGDVNGDGYSDVVVGSRLYDNGESDEGVAFVFHGSSSGLSTSPVSLLEANQPSANFGGSVSSAGDVNGDGYSDVLVGASQFDNGQVNEGRAFVFLGSASGVSTSPAWATESDQAAAEFGLNLSAAGDVNGDAFGDVIVGALGFDNGTADIGKAYVYHGSGSGLSTSANWTFEGPGAGGLGERVATAGDLNGDGYGDVVVASPQLSNGQSNEGVVYAFFGSSTGLAASPSWSGESNQIGANYGIGLATAGDVDGDGYSDLLVGANSFDDTDNNEGRVFLYLGDAGGPISSGWTLDGDQDSAFLGPVSSAGDVNGDGYSDVIVGAGGYTNGETSEGRVQLFLGSASGLATNASLSFESNQASSGFASALASAGDVNGDGYSDVLIGASSFDDDQSDEGKAYVYHGEPEGLAETAVWIGQVDQASAYCGWSVAAAGDVNGDGFGDVVVGAFGYDNGSSDEGAAFLYLGSSGGPSSSPDWTGEGNQSFANFGVSVAGAGDVNGDGYSDVIVGAYRYDNIEVDEGRAFIFQGSPSGLSSSPAWTGEANQPSADYGFSVAGAGDFNGDGFSDAVVGARLYDNGSVNEGQVFLYRGSSSGLSSSPTWARDSGQASSFFGYSLGSGDTNADGYDDLIVGAYNFTNGESGEGRAMVFFGSPAGPASAPSWTGEPDQAGAQFGLAVTSVGDVNGDGFADVAVGSPGFDNGELNEGRTYFYWGSPSGPSISPNQTIEIGQVNANSGYSVDSAGDFNGDGFGDVAIGAPFYDDGSPGEGAAWVWMGSSTGLGSSQIFQVNQSDANLGYSVAYAGDVNGDGYGDVIAGAYRYDDGSTDEGGAFVLLGNNGRGGLVRKLQQRDRDDAQPLAVVGRLERDGMFRIQCEFPKNPAGFGLAAAADPTAFLEWEVKPLGAPFDGTGIERGAGQSLLPAGGSLAFNELVTTDGVARAHRTRGTSFHWRARIATNNPLFPHTAWFSAQGNSITEAKLRLPRLQFP